MNPVQSLPSTSSSISGGSANSVRIPGGNSRRRPALKVLSRARSQNVEKPQKETPRASLAADRPKISGASLLASVNQVPRTFSKARAQTGAETAKPQISTPPETFATDRPQASVSRQPDAIRAVTPPRPRGPEIIRKKGQQASPRGLDSKSKSNRIKFSEKKKNYDYEEDDSLILRKPSVYGCKHLCGTLIYDVYQLLGGKVCDC